jgi:hypothetical protein
MIFVMDLLPLVYPLYEFLCIHVLSRMHLLKPVVG